MKTAATADRARQRLDALACVGLDRTTFIETATEVMRTALPFDAACTVTTDPATELITSATKWGMGASDAEDRLWAFHEYEAEDLYDFRDVVRRPGGVTSVVLETDGDPRRSPRYAEFFEPTYGFTDELRAGARVDGLTWGYFALFRHGGHPFTPAEHAWISTVSPAISRGLRASLLVGSATAHRPDHGPGVIVVDAADQVVQSSLSADEHVADLGGDLPAGSALPVALDGLVRSARGYAAGRHTTVPRARLRTLDGRWVVAHASPLRTRGDSSGPTGVDTGAGTSVAARGDIVVTIEEARPPEIIPIVVAAFGLTGREQDVVRLVLQGVSTKEISAGLHLSAYTVQDHLKSVFEKVGVRSRRELSARVFFDQYASRLGTGGAPGASGWFEPDEQ